MVDPWAEISSTPHVTVHYAKIDGAAAVTDGHSNVWLDDRLTAVERLCALTHELVHLEEGHLGHQSEDVERSVRAKAARMLVPFDRLWRLRHWQGSTHSLAEELGVTHSVLRDRLEAATADEQAALRAAYWEHAGEC